MWERFCEIYDDLVVIRNASEKKKILLTFYFLSGKYPQSRHKQPYPTVTVTIRRKIWVYPSELIIHLPRYEYIHNLSCIRMRKINHAGKSTNITFHDCILQEAGLVGEVFWPRRNTRINSWDRWTSKKRFPVKTWVRYFFEAPCRSAQRANVLV